MLTGTFFSHEGLGWGLESSSELGGEGRGPATGGVMLLDKCLRGVGRELLARGLALRAFSLSSLGLVTGSFTSRGSDGVFCGAKPPRSSGS